MKEPLQNPNGTLRPPSEGFVPSDHTGPRRDRRGKAMKLACALFLVCAAVAWAQPPAQQTLPEVVVTASRIPVPALTAPAFTRVITANEIKNSSGASLGDLLRSTAGLHVSSDGPTGAVTSLSIRGATSSEVLVLLNGVPLNSSLDGSVDLSSIPTDSIARIEIVRGGESSVYGTGAIGGVVNIITKKADRQPSLDVSVENRSYLPHAADLVYPGMVAKPVPANPLDLLDSQKLSGSASGVLGKVGLAGVFGFTRAANAFVWKDSTYSNAWRKENHAGGLSGNGYLHLGIPTAVGEISSATSVVSSSFDVPGTLSGPGLTTTASQERTTAGETIGYASPSSTNGRAAARSKLYYRYERLHYADPATQPPTDSTTVTNSAGGYASGSYRFSDLLSLIHI